VCLPSDDARERFLRCDLQLYFATKVTEVGEERSGPEPEIGCNFSVKGVESGFTRVQLIRRCQRWLGEQTLDTWHLVEGNSI